MDVTAGSGVGRRPLANAYRSFFTFSPRPDSTSLILGAFGSWLRERKGIDIDLGSSRLERFGQRELAVTHNDKAYGRQLRLVLREEQDDGETWKTELTALVPLHSTHGWLNLQVANSAGRPADPPGVYNDLVNMLAEPRDGELRLHSSPPRITVSSVDEVEMWICDPDRHALLFVAGSSRELDFDSWATQVDHWAYKLRGMGQAVILDPAATAKLAEQLGPWHEVPPWSIRTFYPDASPGTPTDGRRHRILGMRRLGSEPDRSIQKLLTLIARRHANDRPTPPTLARVTRDLDRVSTALRIDSIFAPSLSEPTTPPVTIELPVTVAASSHPSLTTVTEDLSPAKTIRPVEPSALAEMQELIAEQARTLQAVEQILGESWNFDTIKALSLAGRERDAGRVDQQRLQTVLDHSKTELQRSLTRVDDLDAQLDGLRGELKVEQDERTFAELQRVEAEDEVRWLRGELKKLQRYDLAHARLPKEAETDPPLSFDDLIDKLPELDSAGVHFTGDEKFLRQLSEIDSTGRFALLAWEALLALCSYLEARTAGDFDGNVKQFLDELPAGYRGYAPGKHSPTESDPTMQQYGNLRRFPVSADVDASGFVTMAAHFRLGKAGMSSPRMHYIDSFPLTGKVYVGYLGPHLRTVSTN